MILSTTTLIIVAALSGGQYDNTAIVNAYIESPQEIEALRDCGVNSLACFDHHGHTPMLFEKEHFALAEKLGIEIKEQHRFKKKLWYSIKKGLIL